MAVVEPSTERTYWVLFRRKYETTDDINEIECKEIFADEYVGAPKLKKASETKNMSDEERLIQFRKLYEEQKQHV